jgi:hypothetical protein
LEGSSVLTAYFRRTGKAVRERGPLVNDPTARILQALLAGLACAMILEGAALPASPRKLAVAVLARGSKRFAYTEILNVLEGCNSQFAEEVHDR